MLQFEELKLQLISHEEELANLAEALGLEKMKNEIAVLEEQQAQEGFWDDINIFIKYGCMREEKLYDKVKDALLLKTTDGVYETVSEYLEKNKEKHENVIYFANDVNQQAQYLRLFQEQGLEAAILETPVDKPFVSFLEYKHQDIKLKLQRVDADIDSLQEKSDAEDSEAKKQAAEFEKNQMQDLFRVHYADNGKDFLSLLKYCQQKGHDYDDILKAVKIIRMRGARHINTDQIKVALETMNAGPLTFSEEQRSEAFLEIEMGSEDVLSQLDAVMCGNGSYNAGRMDI